ncbi:MAG: TIGR04283 family arsenosugar biosynthesis glycosyltransferase [Pseudomonadota bacterium]
MASISVIIPTLNAQAGLPATLASLFDGAVEGLVKEVVIVDGGSSDLTCTIAEETGARVVAAERGRGRQLALGAAEARADWLLFLHADTVLAEGWIGAVTHFISRQAACRQAAAFQFALDAKGLGAGWLSLIVRLRCWALRLPYGDQGLLISREHYDALGGFRPLPLMEDVDLVRRIGWRGMHLLPAKAVTSAERYRRGGYIFRPLRNIALLGLYFAGVAPERLARWYGYR